MSAYAKWIQMMSLAYLRVHVLQRIYEVPCHQGELLCCGSQQILASSGGMGMSCNARKCNNLNVWFSLQSFRFFEGTEFDIGVVFDPVPIEVNNFLFRNRVVAKTSARLPTWLAPIGKELPLARMEKMNEVTDRCWKSFQHLTVQSCSSSHCCWYVKCCCFDVHLFKPFW